ncbi:MAG: hypothetical protein ACREDK_07230 [Thermoplasmata archaeon]
MTETHKDHAIAPLLLGGLALLLIVVATIAPATGALPAQTNCPYGNCTPVGTDYTTYYIGIAIAAVLVAIIATFFLFRRRGRSPPSASQEESYGGGPGGEYAAPEGPTPPSAAPGPEAAYLESPEDIGASTPSVAAPAAAAGAAAGAEGESDIDSLMQELDRISGEILKRGTPKKGEAAAKPESTDDTDHN